MTVWLVGGLWVACGQVGYAEERQEMVFPEVPVPVCQIFFRESGTHRGAAPFGAAPPVVAPVFRYRFISAAAAEPLRCTASPGTRR